MGLGVAVFVLVGAGVADASTGLAIGVGVLDGKTVLTGDELAQPVRSRLNMKIAMILEWRILAALAKPARRHFAAFGRVSKSALSV